MDVGGQVEWEANIAQILSRTKQNLANLQRYPQVTSPVPQPYPPPPPAPPYYNNNGVNNNNNYSYTLGLLSTSREPAGMNRRTSSVQQNPAVCLSPDYNNGNNNNFPPPQLSIKTQQQVSLIVVARRSGEGQLHWLLLPPSIATWCDNYYYKDHSLVVCATNSSLFCGYVMAAAFPIYLCPLGRG